MSDKLRISRRTVLRGAGAAIALPWLEAMAPAPWSSASAAGGKAPPLRMAFVYVPNGKHMQDWTPAGTGAGYATPYILEPLNHLKNDFLVLTGLTLDKARANGDGAGDHARSAAAALTASQPRKTAGADIKVGVSVDQVAAGKIGKATRFASLELGVEGGLNSGGCDSGYSCAYSGNISWRTANAPMTKEVNPRAAFDRLFGDAPKAAPGQAVNKRDLYKKSILDFVMEDTGSLKNKLGAADQHKLDEYLTSIREIEQRIGRGGHSADDAPPAGDAIPAGNPRDYQEHIRLMCDVMALAFQGDVTRIATLMFANEGSNRSYAPIGVSEGHHDLSHHGNDAAKHAKIRTINRFHITQLAYLLDKLKGLREGEGSVLDHCMLVYLSGISDGDRHNHENLPVLLAGKAGGAIKPGRHLSFPKNTPMANLYVTMLNRMGAGTNAFGDSNGALSLA